MRLRLVGGGLLAAGMLVWLPALAGEQVAWLSNPVTDNHLSSVGLPDTNRLADTFRLSLTPGEFEPASFIVYSDTGLDAVLPVTGEISSGDVKLPATAFDIRIVKYWYQASRDSMRGNVTPISVPELLLKNDALVKVEDKKNYLLVNGEYRDISKRAEFSSRIALDIEKWAVTDADELLPVAVNAGESRQYWLTLKAPADAVPGVYRGTVEVKSGDSVVAQLPLEVEILPFKLAASELTYSIFHRAYLDKIFKQGSVSSEVRSESQYLTELRNLVDHGITKPNLYQLADSPMLDRALELRQLAGVEDQDALYFEGLWAVPGENERPVPPGFETRMTQTKKQLAGHGINNVYAFGRDEARGDRLTIQKEVWTLTRELGFKVFASGYHTTNVTGPGNFDLMSDYQDVFVAINPVTREESARWHSKGKTILSYQNPTGGMERPETYRKNYGLYLWQMNYDGAMHYAYQDSFGNGWNDFDHTTYRDHNFVYPTADGVIDTLQWEGAREGVDDTRYLATLNDAIAMNADSDVAKEATAWLAALKEVPVGRMDAVQVREAMAGYVLALSGAVESSADAELADIAVVPGVSPGDVEIRWTSNERSASKVMYGYDPEVLENESIMSALVFHHRIPLSGLNTGGKLYFRVEANGLISDVNSIDLSAEPVLSAAVKDEVLQVAVTGPEYLHAFVDWDDSLMGWWRFSEVDGSVVSGSAGVDMDGTLSGDAYIGDGYIGNGVVMDGRSDYFVAENIETGAGDPVTIEGWFRFDEFAQQRQRNQDIFTGLYQHSINNHFYIKDTNTFFEVSSLLKRGVWHHIALTYDVKTEDAILYLDGQEIPATATTSRYEMQPLDGFGVGRSSGYLRSLLTGGTTQFAGAVDEVRVWGRRLSSEEIRASYGFNLTEFKSAPGGATSYTVTVVSKGDKVVQESGALAAD